MLNGACILGGQCCRAGCSQQNTAPASPSPLTHPHHSLGPGRPPCPLASASDTPCPKKMTGSPTSTFPNNEKPRLSSLGVLQTPLHFFAFFYPKPTPKGIRLPDPAPSPLPPPCAQTAPAPCPAAPPLAGPLVSSQWHLTPFGRI